MQRHGVNPIAQKYWESSAKSFQYLAAYWKSLWALPCMEREISFKWLLLHYALPISFHLKGHVDDCYYVCC